MLVGVLFSGNGACMNAQTLASFLNGRQYRSEISEEEAQIAKEIGLVVVFGASDDLIEFRGAVYDELGAWEGATIYLLNRTPVHESEFKKDLDVLQKYGFHLNPKKIKATWCPEYLKTSWLIEADGSFPFDIFEGDELYCRGCVFEI